MTPKKNLQHKKTFNHIQQELLDKGEIHYQFYDWFISEGHIAWLVDKYVNFGRLRGEKEIHNTCRPMAVLKKHNLKAWMMPGTHENSENQYYHKKRWAIYIKVNEIPELKRSGWFLVDHSYPYPAEDLQKMKPQPGTKIPDAIFERFQQKYREFMAKKGRRVHGF
ncbi:MAG: hypothetical protein AB7W47_17220 [Calditrichaceae bacterium]